MNKKSLLAGLLAVALALPAGTALASELERFGCGGPQPAASEPDAGHPELRQAIAMDLYLDNFKAVMGAADSWRSSDCRLRNGVAQLGYWLAGFSHYFSAQKGYWAANYDFVQRWNAAFPGHPLSKLVESRFWSDYAIAARGLGAASTVTDEGWRLFGERLSKSEAVLLDMPESERTWPHWYLQAIRVQSLLERPPAVVRSTFTEGIKRFPHELGIYQEMSYYLEPRWGGSWTEVAEVVELAVRNARADDADATYATLYQWRGDLHPRARDFFADSGASWPRMKRGFVKLLERYPRSSQLANSLLAYACAAADKASYREYRSWPASYDEGAWTRGRDRSSCDKEFGVEE